MEDSTAEKGWWGTGVALANFLQSGAWARVTSQLKVTQGEHPRPAVRPFHLGQDGAPTPHRPLPAVR